MLTKGEAYDAEGSAFKASVKGKERVTERVVVFEKGPLAGLVRFEFKAMGKFRFKYRKCCRRNK